MGYQRAFNLLVAVQIVGLMKNRSVRHDDYVKQNDKQIGKI